MAEIKNRARTWISDVFVGDASDMLAPVKKSMNEMLQSLTNTVTAEDAIDFEKFQIACIKALKQMVENGADAAVLATLWRSAKIYAVNREWTAVKNYKIIFPMPTISEIQANLLKFDKIVANGGTVGFKMKKAPWNELSEYGWSGFIRTLDCDNDPGDIVFPYSKQKKNQRYGATA